MSATTTPASSFPRVRSRGTRAPAGDAMSVDFVRRRGRALPPRRPAGAHRRYRDHHLAVREARPASKARPAWRPAARGANTAGLLAKSDAHTKDDERIDALQILGDGPLNGVTVDAAAAGTVRATSNIQWRAQAAWRGARPSRPSTASGWSTSSATSAPPQPFSGQIASPARSTRMSRPTWKRANRWKLLLACDALAHSFQTLARSTSSPASSSQALPGSEGALVAEARALVAGGGILRAQGAARWSDVVAAVLGDRLGKVETRSTGAR